MGIFRNTRILAAGMALAITGLALFCAMGQSKNEMERQKQAAEKEIKDTKAELSANEKKVTEGLMSLRKLDEEIATSQKEIETVKGQITTINGNISALETSISKEEAELKGLRDEYLKAVKKMRVARKQNSGMAFLFSSGSFNEARRRMRYMKEFSDWKDRRSAEIDGKVKLLQDQHKQLNQARNDAAVALGREQAAQEKLSRQKGEQQVAVNQLRANSETLRQKIARRQAEARKLSNQISQLIAEQQAKEKREAEARRKAEEEKRLAEERRKAEEKRLAEEKAAAERRAAEERKLAEAEAKKADTRKEEKKKEETPKKEEPKKQEAKKETTAKREEPKKEESKSKPSGGEYAEARKRQRSGSASTSSSSASSTSAKASEPATVPAAPAASGFEGMKGSLPKPVGGSFRIVSAFGVHPISPELPDIMDENLGIDAHVANGAAASAVYEGEVIKIYDRTNTPGFRNIVVVKHGDYITVYANLETLSVHSGQKVKQGQTLGTVGSDFDDPAHGLIHFEVWKNQTHLNPAAWIRM